jgi:uncharacterized membrane-anchored protein
MKARVLVAVSLLCICGLMAVGQSKKRPSPSPSPTPDAWSMNDNVSWQRGPSMGQLGINAEVKIPEGYIFANARDTRTLMEATKNPINNNELGLIALANEDWFVVFEFDDVGYVKDEEKTFLDADEILKSIKEGTEESNKERVRRGWPTLNILGWETTPRYNETTHNLEWATRSESEGFLVVNHNTRLLGREGVMRVTLVTDPETLPETLPKFRQMLQGFQFKEGHEYAAFTSGDKTAAYGLTGLIVAGGAAAAVKTGAFKWLWKVLVAVAVGLSGLVKKLFSRNKS